LAYDQNQPLRHPAGTVLSYLNLVLPAVPERLSLSFRAYRHTRLKIEKSYTTDYLLEHSLFSIYESIQTSLSAASTRIPINSKVMGAPVNPSTLPPQNLPLVS